MSISSPKCFLNFYDAHFYRQVGKGGKLARIWRSSFHIGWAELCFKFQVYGNILQGARVSFRNVFTQLAVGRILHWSLTIRETCMDGGQALAPYYWTVTFCIARQKDRAMRKRSWMTRSGTSSLLRACNITRGSEWINWAPNKWCHAT